MCIPSIGHGVNQLRQKFSHSVGLPIRDALPAATIEAVIRSDGIPSRRRLLDPVVTIWAFLSQVLDTDRCCRKAMSRVWAYLAESTPVPLGVADTAADTGAYCKARQRLSENVIHRLYTQVADTLEAQVAPEQLWCGRPVYLVDGTILLMPDTPENQAAYPQYPNQKDGCGFPLAKMVAIFSLCTGALTEAILDVWSVYEPALLRRIHGVLRPGDVLVGDRIYCTYVDLCLLKTRAVDALFGLHAARKVDFRKGQRLAKDDHLFTWKKPLQRPKGLSREHYQSVPPTLEIRVVRFVIHRPGFRAQSMMVATTLVDPVTFPAKEIARLYGLRWEVEINLRHFKTSMDMEMLRTKSSPMVRKELAMYCLAYNLIRSLMAQAARAHDTDPARLSFKGTLQHLNTFLPLLAIASAQKRTQYYDTLLLLVAREKLPDRPDRHEPRVVKRRPKAFRRMQEPRAVLKQKVAA
jgi:hypothetical protein